MISTIASPKKDCYVSSLFNNSDNELPYLIKSGTNSGGSPYSLHFGGCGLPHCQIMENRKGLRQ